MTKDEALKLALEAEGVQPSKKSMAITELYALFGAPHNADINLARLNKLLDELMAQPEQEPVACTHEWVDDTKLKPQWRCAKCGAEYTKEKA